MRFKNYSRQYEFVYTDPKKLAKRCRIDEVSAFGGIPGNTTIYLKTFQQETKKFQQDVFDHLVKIDWLVRRFCYQGIHRKKIRGNGHVLDRAYANFLRYFVNFNSSPVYYHHGWTRKIISYFDDFFPNFDLGNPFKEEYVYPFRFITLDCLLLVNQMPERLELLRVGEERKMVFAQFIDYILNYISCYNEEHGETYCYIYNNAHFPVIKRIKKI